MQDVELEFVLPPEDLRPYVGLFYAFHTRTEDCFDDLERAGTAQLRFRLSPGHACYHFADGRVVEAPAVHLLGPTMGAVRTCVDGPVRVFGIGLSPAGWAALVGSDASTLADDCIDATPLLAVHADRLIAALSRCSTPAAMVAKVEPWLRRQIGNGHGPSLAFSEAVDAWLAAAASPELCDLEDGTGLSRRQVERRCNAIYGAPPKLIARKYRALRAAVAMASGQTMPIDGFYDQSHMIREVKHFTGLTPRKMRERPGLLAQRTITQRRALEGQVTVLVSDT
ncbi:helix-turn-helix domain-containing protein [uncultured Sphingomonas sp.]|uniref:AraC family transcriptional regulator n=1 Tax=uncultured Sphingomonas sp. TaxID=158754 RepID=UPI0035CC1552